jgi:hypothetical protein
MSVGNCLTHNKQKCFDRSPEDYQKYQQQRDELKK